MIQFPAGLPQLGAESLASPRILPALANLATTAQTPADILELGQTAAAALDLELLQTLPQQPARAAGAAQYQLAIDAVQQGDNTAGVQHLEQAILADPVYTETVRQDPSFEAIRGPVQDLVGRLNVLARMRADTSIAEAAAAIESAQMPESATHAALPQTAAALSVPEDVPTTAPSLPVPPVQPSPAPSDALPLPRAGVAAIEIELLHRWNDPAPREAGAVEYQLAREAEQVGDHTTALQHLEQAIAAQPAYAAAAAQDPAFAPIRGPIQQLVNRAIPQASLGVSAAEPTAEAQADSFQAARAGTDAVRFASPFRSPDASDPIPQAQAYLDVARAHFDLGTYTGYVAAAQAAVVAQGIAQDSRVSAPSKRRPLPDSGRERGLQLLKHAVWRAARRLWEEMPLLAILLGWFTAGALAGTLSLPFQEGSIAAMRGLLFPVWALGLVAMVLAGFVRSLRRRW